MKKFLTLITVALLGLSLPVMAGSACCGNKASDKPACTKCCKCDTCKCEKCGCCKCEKCGCDTKKT